MASSTKSNILLVMVGTILGIMLTAALFVGQAQAQQRVMGSYIIAHHSNPNALAGVFRLNQATGYMSYCYIDGAGRPQVTCTQETP